MTFFATGLRHIVRPLIGGHGLSMRPFLFHYNKCSHCTIDNSVQTIAHFIGAMLNLTRNSGLAAVGHGLELLAVFPRLRLIPRHLGSAMIVWIADEGCLLL